MGSEKPPRRAKAKQEPAIIDMEATDAANEAIPATSPGDAISEALTELPDAVPVETPVAATGPDHAQELPNADEPKAADEEKPEDIGTAEALAAEPVPETETEIPVAAPTVIERKSGTSVTGAIAAGIFGGLVALAGAGSMQYAGYLPSLGAAPTAPAQPSAGTAAIEAELATLKSSIAALAARPAGATADTSALEARLAALETAGPGAPAAAPVDLAPVEARIAALEGQLTQLEGSVAGADEKQQSIQTNLIDRLQKVETDVNDTTHRNAVARAIAASGLKAAIDRGGSFVSELETFAGVAADEPAVAGLTPYAQTGVPTRAALIASFPDAANAVLAVVNKPDPNEGVVDRLWSSALSLVKVRPVGHVEGDTPEAFIARAEEALKGGDLDAALAEWNRLPEEGRAAAPDFGKALAARIEVEKLVGATLKNAVLGAAGN